MTKSPYRVVQAHPLVLEREDDAPEGVAGCLMAFEYNPEQGSCTALFTAGVDLRSDPNLSLRNRMLVCMDENNSLYSTCVSRNGTMGDMLPDEDALIRALWTAASEAEATERVKLTGVFRRTRPDEGSTDKTDEDDACSDTGEE